MWDDSSVRVRRDVCGAPQKAHNVERRQCWIQSLQFLTEHSRLTATSSLHFRCDEHGKISLTASSSSSDCPFAQINTESLLIETPSKTVTHFPIQSLLQIRPLYTQTSSSCGQGHINRWMSHGWTFPRMHCVKVIKTKTPTERHFAHYVSCMGCSLGK